jgi:methionyl-tRNA formyltransferase
MDIKKSPKSTCFFGNRGVFSATVFNHLIQDGISISRVFCASPSPALTPQRSLPVTQPIKEEGLDTLANRLAIPVQYIKSRAELDSLNIQKLSKPDFILVACFPFRLPETFINWPILGCLNIHPSLLPQYRGPDPLFWQLHNGEPQAGVSLHLVRPRMDAGPIVSQKFFSLKDGATRYDLEISSAKKGAGLFTSLLTKDITQPITGEPQDESNASYFPNPSKKDYEISLDWNAQQAFNFIKGTCSPSNFYKIKTKGKPINIISTVKRS